MEKATGTKVTFIPYRGAGPAMTDLISGQVDLLVVQGAVALPQVRAGTIKAIANLSPQRSASMPGHPDLGRRPACPALHVGLVRVLRAQGHAEGRDRQAQRRDGAGARRSGGEGAASPSSASTSPPREQQTPEGLAAFHKAEIEKWWPIIKAANIKEQ